VGIARFRFSGPSTAFGIHTRLWRCGSKGAKALGTAADHVLVCRAFTTERVSSARRTISSGLNVVHAASMGCDDAGHPQSCTDRLDDCAKTRSACSPGYLPEPVRFSKSGRAEVYEIARRCTSTAEEFIEGDPPGGIRSVFRNSSCRGGIHTSRAACCLFISRPCGFEVRLGMLLSESVAARIKGEYREMPGLSLTPSQACRLWQVDPSLCQAVLDQLVREDFLYRMPSGAYVARPTPGGQVKAALRTATSIRHSA